MRLAPTTTPPRIFFAALIATAAIGAWARSDEIAEGIVYRFRTTSKPLRIHVLRIDLASPRVRLRTALASDTVTFAPPERASSMAARHGAVAAVNADYFGSFHHNVEELFYTDGRLVYAPAVPFRSILNISRDHEVHIGMDRSGLRFHTTIGGGPQLVRDGRFVWDTSIPDRINGEGFSPNTKFNGANPSTAVGVTRDGRMLILMVVDGRQPGFSVGVTPSELATLLIREGAWQAMRFDGGGSSTMWILGRGVVNSPSEGSERAVGSALLVLSATDERFVRGDANGDGIVDLSDAVRVLLHLFAGAPEPPCLDAADATDSERITITDAVSILEFVFLAGPRPSSPFPRCGDDRSGEALDCGRNSCSA